MANDYYQKHKGTLWKKACERYKDISVEGKKKRLQIALYRYQNLSEEEKKRHQYHRERYSEEQKQKQVQYKRNYYLVYKTQLF